MAGKDGAPVLNCKTAAFEPQDLLPKHFPNMEETSSKYLKNKLAKLDAIATKQ